MITQSKMIQRLKEDSDYKEFFKNALSDFSEKFGSDDIGSWTDKQKKEFFTWIEDNWTTENPETNDGDVNEQEDPIRLMVRKELKSMLRKDMEF